MTDKIPTPLGTVLRTPGDLLILKTNLLSAILDSDMHTDHLKELLKFVQDRLDAFDLKEVP